MTRTIKSGTRRIPYPHSTDKDKGNHHLWRAREKIGVSNARNLDYPLGSISTTLYELQEEWAEEIPRIDIPRLTSIVVSKDTRLPSYPPGITPSEFEDVQKTIYNFPLWTSVLEAIVNKGFSQV